MNKELKIEEEAIWRIISAAAPEREPELQRLWKKAKPKINFMDDRWGFSLEAGAFGLVRFDHKTMCQIWLLGFMAQKALHIYSPFLYVAQILRLPFSPDILTDKTFQKQYMEAEAVCLSIANLKESDSMQNFVWPQNIPNPNGGKPSDLDGSMCFDLLCMASAYCFLHEIKHVAFRASKTILKPHQEEFRCDKYAREFLLDKVSIYSKNSGDNEKMVITKRAMAIAMASILLLVITPITMWKGSETHPAISQRIMNLIRTTKIPESSYLWIYLSCLLLFVLTQNKISVPFISIKAQKSYCISLIDILDKHSRTI